MGDSLQAAMNTAASGMRAQGTRTRIISENIANAQSTSEIPGGDPYRRKMVVFEDVLDKNTGGVGVRVARIREDFSAFKLTFDPSHPAADENGYVKTPNVNQLIEGTDMREAQRSYEANVNVMQQARSMILKTTEMLKY